MLVYAEMNENNNGLERAAKEVAEGKRGKSSAIVAIFHSNKNTTLLSFVFSLSPLSPGRPHQQPRAPRAGASSSSGHGIQRPGGGPFTSGYGDESKGKLHGGGHKGGAPTLIHPLGVWRPLPPALDSHSLDKLKHQALAKARAVQSSLIAAVKSGSSGGIGGGRAAAAPTSQSSHGGFGVVSRSAPQAAPAGAPDAALSASRPSSAASAIRWSRRGRPPWPAGKRIEKPRLYI